MVYECMQLVEYHRTMIMASVIYILQSGIYYVDCEYNTNN